MNTSTFEHIDYRITIGHREEKVEEIKIQYFPCIVDKQQDDEC